MASAKPGSIVSFASVCFQAATNLNDEKVRKIRNDTRTKKNTPIFGHKIVAKNLDSIFFENLYKSMVLDIFGYWGRQNRIPDVKSCIDH